MNSKVTKIILGVGASFFSLGVIFYIINGVDGLTDLSEYSGDYFSAVRGVTIFELVMAILILAMSIITMIFSFTPSFSKKRALNSIFGVVTMISLEKIVSIISGYIILKKYLYPYVSLSALSIVTVVFIIITLASMVFALTSSWFIKKTIVGIISGITGTVSFLIAMILVLVNSSQSTGFSTLYMIFTLIAVLIMIIGLIFSTLDDKPKSVANTSTPIMEASKDSAEELLKLKKLLDAGAISQEEYEEKRKKYVDSL